VNIRRSALLGAAFAMVGALSLALPTTASAASGYPGTTTVTTVPGGTTPGGGSSAPCASSVTVVSGTTVVVTLTGCPPNSAFSISIAGVSTGIAVTSDASGTITLTNVASGDPFLSVNGSTPVSTKYGPNTVTLTNLAGGAGGTEIVTIPNVLTAALSTGGSGGSSGTLAFTGADLLALVVGAVFLLGTGTLLVVFTRRRASHQQA
jgi:hypothetical protein